mgnify:CR=1 FL=1
MDCGKGRKNHLSMWVLYAMQISPKILSWTIQILSNVWTVQYFLNHYGDVNKKNLLAYKGYLVENFKPQTVNLWVLYAMQISPKILSWTIQILSILMLNNELLLNDT